MALIPEARRFRKLIKTARPSKVSNDVIRGFPFSFFFDDRYYSTVSVSLPTNMICERIRNMRERYEEDLYFLKVEGTI